eukprot:GDKK01061701.1.p1 GENE.GDKK01061701.1~~GDKK01061701.1.p1  ORF type:complete len:167 (+),score=20.83 GDKK01061701.1:1-501(+)
MGTHILQKNSPNMVHICPGLHIQMKLFEKEENKTRKTREESISNQTNNLTEAVNHTVLSDELLCCAECSHVITSSNNAFSLDGEAGKVFTNPAGVSFHVSYFSTCEGAMIVGPYSGEASWFEGTRWAFLLCGGCQQHLGWHYRYSTNQSPFFGIISSKLVPVSAVQ